MAIYCNTEEIKESDKEYPELIDVLDNYKTELINRSIFLNSTGVRHIIVVAKIGDPGVKNFVDFLDNDIDWQEFEEDPYLLGVADKDYLLGFSGISEFISETILFCDDLTALLVSRLGFKLHKIE